MEEDDVMIETPPMDIAYKGEKEVVVTIFVLGLEPTNDLIDENHKARNGLVDVTFLNGGYGMDAKITLYESNKKKKVKEIWRQEIRKFPSKIDMRKRNWRIEKNKVIITLTKVLEPGDKEFIDWEPLVYENSLDQYREEEEIPPEKMPFDPSKEGFPTTNIWITVTDKKNQGQNLVALKPP